MKITFPCKACKALQSVILSENPSKLVCPRCFAETPLIAPASLQAGRVVERCAICGRDKFYVQKDFSRKIGLTLVFIGILLSSYYTYYEGLPGLFVLIGIALLDRLVYYFLPWMTICYTCRAEYRGFKKNPNHEFFDLKAEEQYGKY